eukprot:3342269-Prymnesium_polylepis.1
MHALGMYPRGRGHEPTGDGVSTVSSATVIKPQKELLVFLMRNLPTSRRSLEFDDVSCPTRWTEGGEPV